MNRIDAATDTFIAVARYRSYRRNSKTLALHKCNAEFLPPPIGSPVKGSRQLAAEGFLWRIDAATDTFISGDPVRGCAGNRSVSRNASALLRFATHTCRERIYPFRLPRFSPHPPVGLTQKPYRYQRQCASKCLPLKLRKGKAKGKASAAYRCINCAGRCDMRNG